MKNEYKLREITPEAMMCVLGSCPAIYEVERVTPEEMQCGGLACPEVYQDTDSYFIIGTQVNPEDAGLENKVGDGEVLIKVPKKLIDNRGK